MDDNHFDRLLTGSALLELSKEKSSLKQAEAQTHMFVKTLSQVESKLTEQINYLTQVSTGMFLHLFNNLDKKFKENRCKSESNILETVIAVFMVLANHILSLLRPIY